ncbi:MAG: hypothetical protein NT018_13130, partial [Armatimonadetes bacterium]|nr:hypothetical protein [Armatimonadota bacterium]
MNETVPQLIWSISWQTAILAAIVWVVSRIAKKAPAAWRCALWVMIIAKFMIPPFAYLPEQFALRTQPIEIPVVSVSTPPPSTTVYNAAPPTQVEPAPPASIPVAATSAAPVAPEPTPISATSIIFAAWISGVCAMALFLIIRVSRQSKLIRQAQHVSEPINSLLADCAARLGVKRTPLILQSELASTPMLVGLFRPIIILPMGMPETCPEPELRAMFLHELAHIKRWDMAVLWLYHIVNLAFYFNPALWLAGKELKRERELACDELVLASSGITRQDYAAGYVSALKMASATRTPVSLAMAEPFEMEKNRLHSILWLPIRKLSPAWIAALVLVCAVGLPTFIGCAKSPNVAVTRYALISDRGFVLRYKKPFVWKSNKVTIIVTGIGCTDPNTLRKERMLMLVGKIKYSHDSYSFAGQTFVDGRKVEFRGSGGDYEWFEWQNAFPMPSTGSKWINEFSGELDCSLKGQTFKRSFSAAELRTPRELYKNKLALLMLDNGITPIPREWKGQENPNSRYINLWWIRVVALTDPQVLTDDNNIFAYGADGKRVLLRSAMDGGTSFDRYWQRPHTVLRIRPNRDIRPDWQRLVNCTKSYGDASLYQSSLISDKPVPPNFKLKRIEFTISSHPMGKPVPFTIRDIPIPKEFWEKPKPAASRPVQIASITKEDNGPLYHYKNPVKVKGDGWSLEAVGIG